MQRSSSSHKRRSSSDPVCITSPASSLSTDINCTLSVNGSINKTHQIEKKNIVQIRKSSEFGSSWRGGGASNIRNVYGFNCNLSPWARSNKSDIIRQKGVNDETIETLEPVNGHSFTINKSIDSIIRKEDKRDDKRPIILKKYIPYNGKTQYSSNQMESHCVIQKELSNKTELSLNLFNRQRAVKEKLEAFKKKLKINV